MTLQERIDAELIRESNEKDKRVRSGKFGASSFGKCIRAQVYNRLNIPQSEPFDIKTIHMFEGGKIIHAYIQKFFPSGQCEVKTESEHFIGYADLVLDDIVWDIKSVNPAYFFHTGFGEKRRVFTTQEVDENILRKKESNILQVTDYAMSLGKERIGLVFFSRDLSYGIRAHEWTSYTATWSHKVEEEKARLIVAWNKYQEKGELPEPEPRLYDGAECRYCGWRSYCKSGKK